MNLTRVLKTSAMDSEEVNHAITAQTRDFLAEVAALREAEFEYWDDIDCRLAPPHAVPMLYQCYGSAMQTLMLCVVDFTPWKC